MTARARIAVLAYASRTGAGRSVSAVAFSPDGKILATGDGRIFPEPVILLIIGLI